MFEPKLIELARQLVDELHRQDWTLAVAESCTGGLLGALITEVPGASKVFLGGVVAYSNLVKTDLLHVDQTTIATTGAVSAVVAEQMAANTLDKFQANMAVSLTGIAGPGGGSEEKPVGTIWCGVALKTSEPCAVLLDLSHLAGSEGSRDQIRTVATERALARCLVLLRRS